MNRIKRTLTVTIIFLLAVFLFPSEPKAAAEDGSVKETTFVYNLYWSGIKAGTATMEYRETPESITIKTQAESTPFISLFYKVDDRAETIMNSDGIPKSNLLKIREGKTRRHKETTFEWLEKGRTQKIVYNNILRGKTTEFISEKPVYDPLSAFLEMTKRNMIVGESEYIDVFDNKKFMSTEIRVLRKERKKVPAGTFDTIVVSPLLKTEGIFLKKGAMHIWLTDDKRKIPVFFRSKVKIGSFTAKLVKIQ